MSVIENICGTQPEGFIKVDIASDPNFIFVNDVNYSTKQLFDVEGNTISVNSYTECQHYVLGGWDFTPIKNLETNLQTNLVYTMILLLFFTFFKKKLRLNIWK